MFKFVKKKAGEYICSCDGIFIARIYKLNSYVWRVQDVNGVNYDFRNFRDSKHYLNTFGKRIMNDFIRCVIGVR